MRARLYCRHLPAATAYLYPRQPVYARRHGCHRCRARTTNDEGLGRFPPHGWVMSPAAGQGVLDQISILQSIQFYNPQPLPSSLFPLPVSLLALTSYLLPLTSSLFPLPSSLSPLPSSLFPLPSSLFPLPSSLFTLHSSLFTLHTSLLTLHSSRPGGMHGEIE